jgi:hypothetical protein
LMVLHFQHDSEPKTTGSKTVFCFTLHEIDPRMHRSVISNARRISPRIIVVEPSPDGCPAYRRFARLWHEAMHSIGRFEDYQPISYWKNLIQSCGFRVTTSKKIKQKSLLPSEIWMKQCKTRSVTGECSPYRRDLQV